MPHGGYHGTVTMGTDDKGDPKKIQTSYKDDQGIYQIKGGIGTDSFENIQNQDQGMAAKGSQFRDEITAAMKNAGNTGAGIDALTRIKENPELARAGMTSQDYAGFMRDMFQENPDAMREVFPGASGASAQALGGVMSSVLSANPMGIIGSFVKDTLKEKLGMSQGGDPMAEGIMAKANPAIMISINMGPKLPVNIQEIKEEKKMFRDDKMRASLSGQPNKDQVDLAPYMNTGI
tara:strand:+ start:252 stop:953 length:702 start_codon:yes stop_codon:yes gene_type:complete